MESVFKVGDFVRVVNDKQYESRIGKVFQITKLTPNWVYITNERESTGVRRSELTKVELAELLEQINKGAK